VVFPVAPPAEKAGTYLNWEGRWRDFPRALTSNALTDADVLDAIASEGDVWLGIRGRQAAFDELAELGGWEGARIESPNVVVVQPVSTETTTALLSTWSLLLDKGRLQDGEPYLAGTPPRAVARVASATVPGVAGAAVTVSTDRGEITLPLAVTPMPDGVVWLPSNSTGSAVRATLGAGNGDVVKIGVSA